MYVEKDDDLQVVQKNGPRVFSGPVEKVLKWHKALQDVGILILYEIVGKFYTDVIRLLKPYFSWQLKKRIIFVFFSYQTFNFYQTLNFSNQISGQKLLELFANGIQKSNAFKKGG